MAVPAHFMIHTLVVHTPSDVVDGYGNVVEGESSTRSIKGWLDQIRHEERFEDGRSPDVEDWILFTNDLTVSVSDRVEWPERGLMFTVHGEPAVQYTLTGSDHLEATLRKVDG